MAITIVINEKARKMMVGIVRCVSISNLRSNTVSITEMIIAFTDIRMFAFPSAIPLNSR
jgi:hypothetical protein